MLDVSRVNNKNEGTASRVSSEKGINPLLVLWYICGGEEGNERRLNCQSFRTEGRAGNAWYQLDLELCSSWCIMGGQD